MRQLSGAVAVAAAALAVLACERDFAAPPPLPPAVQVTGFSPAEAFMGDEVCVRGEHFAPQPAQNTVAFGTRIAEILDRPVDDPTRELHVLVPELSGEQVSIKVSWSQGEGVSESMFRYRGPGHPLDNQPSPIEIGALPSAVTSMPGGVLGVLHADSQVFRLLHRDTGLRLDLGLCQTPISSAIAVVESAARSAIQIFYTGLEIDVEQGLDVQARLGRLQFELEDDALVGIDAPDLAGIALEGVQPGKVWAFPRQIAEPAYADDIALADLDEPAVLLIHPGPESSERIDFDDDADPPAAGPVLDLAFEGASRSLYATLRDAPGIWRHELAAAAPFERLDLGNLSQGRFSVLAAVDWDGTPLLIAALGQMLYELVLGNDGFEARSAIPIGGQPFALAAAFTAVGLRAYAAVPEGIVVLGPGDQGELEPLAFISLPSSQGGVQSLVISAPIEEGQRDLVAFADTARDRVLVFEIGRELDTLSEVPSGSLFPQLAFSGAEDLFYISSPWSNAVRVIDRYSCVQESIFGIDGCGGFFSQDLAVLPLSGRDLLLTPLPPPIEEGMPETEPVLYTRVAARLIAGRQELPDCTGSLQGAAETFFAQPGFGFHRMQLIGGAAPRLVFIRQADETEPGGIWTAELSPAADTLAGILAGELRASGIELDANVRIASLDRSGRIAGLLRDERHEIEWIEIEGDGGAAAEIDAALLPLVTDLAIARKGGAHLACLPLYAIGQVLIVLAPQSGQPHVHSIETGGVPMFAFTSPDERRLFVTHPTESKLSVIDIGCAPLPACADVIGTLRVDEGPAELIFNPSGSAAYLSHFYSDRITVIE
ncbi:MAG: hypothetical protein JXR96_00405 [Deltaproteobacteria bacterium]|nr:hypothetical protein [Deltaproteobacteria bacterium]